MAWCFQDESTAYTESVFDRLWETDVLVPAIWPLEVGNVLLSGERAHRLTQADTARFLQVLQALPIIVDTQTSPRAFGPVLALGRENGLSAYDAAYLELAMREGLALATLDESLRTAAGRAGVPLVD
jgi:predicted nucleic acid-binding protein